MFVIKAIKWVLLILTVITLFRVLINKKGGWAACKNSVSKKVQSWFKIPVIGKLLQIAIKVFSIAFKALLETMKMIAKWPIVCTIVAVARKIGRIIVQKWTKIVAWSETE